MLIIGMTGGIGSGKSAAGECFMRLGIPVIEADQIAREVVEPGQPALAEIHTRFGDRVIDREGRLDRSRLRTIIFNDPQAKADLEAILHPRIRERMWAEAQHQTSAYVVLDIPLLVETGQYRSVDRVLVIDVPEETQIERICRRDSATQEQARAIISAQASRTERLTVADDIIDNGGSLTRLDEQIRRLHRKYLELSVHP